MKKLYVFAIFAVVLSLLFCIVLCSCNKDNDKGDNTTPATTTTVAPGGDDGTTEDPNATTTDGGDDGTTEPNVTTTEYVEETDPGLQDITDDPNTPFGEIHIAP